jgi:NADPH:quinone reductase-like Zn-dependent oxidoreductase
MQALYFATTGSLDQLQVAEVPRPQAAAGEALVRIRAAAINPSDPKNVLGKMPETSVPRIPGRDFAGVVVEGPSAWRGKEVLGSGGNLGFSRHGTHAEYAAIPLEALVEKPPTLSFEAAAALGLVYVTAWSALVNAGQLSAADTVLVLGATGAVGSSAARIARHVGARRIIGTMRSESERARTAAIPVDDWIVLDRGPLPQAVGDLTQGHGADLILDVIGGDMVEVANRCLAHRGRHIVIASSPAEVTLNLVDFYHREARLIGVDTLKLSFTECAAILSGIVQLVQRGVLAVPAFEVIALRDAPRAYQAVSSGTSRTKQVISFAAL